MIHLTFSHFLQDEVFVARAPGRLDVMGGIADYSGSLVLQVTILILLNTVGHTIELIPQLKL